MSKCKVLPRFNMSPSLKGADLICIAQNKPAFFKWNRLNKTMIV